MDGLLDCVLECFAVLPVYMGVAIGFYGVFCLIFDKDDLQDEQSS